MKKKTTDMRYQVEDKKGVIATSFFSLRKAIKFCENLPANMGHLYIYRYDASGKSIKTDKKGEFNQYYELIKVI